MPWRDYLNNATYTDSCFHKCWVSIVKLGKYKLLKKGCALSVNVTDNISDATSNRLICRNREMLSYGNGQSLNEYCVCVCTYMYCYLMFYTEKP